MWNQQVKEEIMYLSNVPKKEGIMYKYITIGKRRGNVK